MPNTNSLGNAILFASIAITDTTAHTYRTNPLKNGTGIGIIPAFYNRFPKPYTVAIPIQNGANQELSAAVIGNIDTSQAFSDYVLGTGTIAANSTDILYIYMKGANAFPSEFVSLSLSYATAPTSGSVLAYILFHEG